MLELNADDMKKPYIILDNIADVYFRVVIVMVTDNELETPVNFINRSYVSIVRTNVWPYGIKESRYVLNVEQELVCPFTDADRIIKRNSFSCVKPLLRQAIEKKYYLNMEDAENATVDTIELLVEVLQKCKLDYLVPQVYEEYFKATLLDK